LIYLPFSVYTDSVQSSTVFITKKEKT